MPQFLIATLVVLGLSLAGPLAPAAQAATTCNGLIQNTTVSGDLMVPVNATCALANVTVTGNVMADLGSSFVAQTGVTINGGLVGRNATAVSLHPPAGSVPPKIRSYLDLQYTGSSGNADLTGVTIGGNAFISSFGRPNANNILLASNTIGGNAYLVGIHGLLVTNNRISGWLHCAKVDILVGFGNVAKGGKYGQCSGA
jgi:hypothetical protein